MLRSLKRATLRALKTAGVFRAVAASRWRRDRLLILCYHGISLEDEHQWRPGLYMQPELLEQRFEMLKRGRYPVLPLAEALQCLTEGSLDRKSTRLNSSH